MSEYNGVHQVTATIMQVLAQQGVKNPHTGKPFTEAMLLGVGGGLGAGYILWEFKSHESAIIVMGFSNRWNYPVQYMEKVCKRLGAATVVQEASRKKAADNLQAGLKQGVPFIAWVDKAHLPYHLLPESLKGHVPQQVTVFRVEGDNIIIADLAERLYSVPADRFADGRDRIGSDKNRLMFISPPASIDLPAAIKAGIADQIEHLSRDSESFSLPVLQKWAKLMTHPKDKKSWKVVFKERKGLYITLRSVYEAIRLDGTDGFGLRKMYADFLTEAAGILQQPALKTAADAYQRAAESWQRLAASALPDGIALFAETKKLLHARYDAFRRNDTPALQQAMDSLSKLESQLNGAGFPMDDGATNALFEHIQQGLNDVYQAEVNALNVLKNVPLA